MADDTHARIRRCLASSYTVISFTTSLRKMDYRTHDEARHDIHGYEKWYQFHESILAIGALGCLHNEGNTYKTVFVPFLGTFI